MSIDSASSFWTKLNEDDAFRSRFLAMSQGSLTEFLKSEGFDFSHDDLAMVINSRLQVSPSNMSSTQDGHARHLPPDRAFNSGNAAREGSSSTRA